MKSWLVLWEAGLVIELPPWVIFIYPSALFLHFNIDVGGEFSTQQLNFVDEQGMQISNSFSRMGIGPRLKILSQ
jgi:hypothetical protein